MAFVSLQMPQQIGMELSRINRTYLVLSESRVLIWANEVDVLMSFVFSLLNKNLLKIKRQCFTNQ
jgi:hypothetical protein